MSRGSPLLPQPERHIARAWPLRLKRCRALGQRGRWRKPMTTAASPVRSEPLFATPRVIAEHRADGTIWLKSAMPLQASARCVGDWLEYWARQTTDRIFLADRASVDA